LRLINVTPPVFTMTGTTQNSSPIVTGLAPLGAAPFTVVSLTPFIGQPVSGAGASNSQAFYVQTAYRLPWGERLWKPYYRLEYIHIPLADAIFRAVPSFLSSTIGARYDISSFAAFKFEYRNYSRRNLPVIRGVFLQTSFTF